MKITRRSLAIALVSAAGVAQTPQPADAEEELKAARELLRRRVAAMENHPVPMSVEPAFQFRA